MAIPFRLTIAALALAGGVLAGCGGDDDSSSADSASTSEDTGSSESTASDTTVSDTTADDGPANGGGGGGGEADPSSVTTEAALIELIAEDAYGDGSLDLHRGHQPIESTLEEVLGITHDEMHVRMEEQRQNLATVADDLGVGADNLVDILVEHFSPAIGNVLAAGEITEEEADQYHDDLEEAFRFRVYWDGEEAKPDYTGVA